jgi:hypothetical protein
MLLPGYFEFWRTDKVKNPSDSEYYTRTTLSEPFRFYLFISCIERRCIPCAKLIKHCTMKHEVILRQGYILVDPLQWFELNDQLCAPAT